MHGPSLARAGSDAVTMLGSKINLTQAVAAIATLGVMLFGWHVLSGEQIAAVVVVVQLAGNGLTIVLRTWFCMAPLRRRRAGVARRPRIRT